MKYVWFAVAGAGAAVVYAVSKAVYTTVTTPTVKTGGAK